MDQKTGWKISTMAPIATPLDLDYGVFFRIPLLAVMDCNCNFFPSFSVNIQAYFQVLKNNSKHRENK